MTFGWQPLTLLGWIRETQHDLCRGDVGCHGMKWLRTNIRRISHVALFALAIQLVLSFGHFHGIATQAGPSIQSTLQLPASGHDPDQHPNDVCAICAVVALSGMAVAAAPPALPLPPTIEPARLTIDAPFAHPRSARAAFQSRAPPVS
jgi:hypothetical protein